MIRKTRTGTLSFEDFCDLISEDQKADLLDGVIYSASPENSDHNDLVSWLTAVLRPFIEDRRLGRLTVNKVAYRLSENTSPEPDIGFVANSRIHLIKRGYVDGAPDLAIEIVSPDSVDRDYETKRLKYEEAGVREYWIIDPAEKSTLFLVLEGGRFAEQYPHDHQYQSRVLSGLVMDVRWFFERPLPPTLATVHRILGRS